MSRAAGKYRRINGARSNSWVRVASQLRIEAKALPKQRRRQNQP